MSRVNAGAGLWGAGSLRAQAAVFRNDRWEQRAEGGGGEELAWDQGAALHGA